MKIIIITFLLVSSLFAHHCNMNLKIQILENICSGIENIENMKIYSNDSEIQQSFEKSKKFHVVKSFKEAQIIILTKDTKLVKEFPNKHIFVLKYNLLEKIPNSFGAFFWKKGRPNIVFIKPRLQEQSLKLSSDLEHYIEEKIW